MWSDFIRSNVIFPSCCFLYSCGDPEHQFRGDGAQLTLSTTSTSCLQTLFRLPGQVFRVPLRCQFMRGVQGKHLAASLVLFFHESVTNSSWWCVSTWLCRKNGSAFPNQIYSKLYLLLLALRNCKRGCQNILHKINPGFNSSSSDYFRKLR